MSRFNDGFICKTVASVKKRKMYKISCVSLRDLKDVTGKNIMREIKAKVKFSQFVYTVFIVCSVLCIHFCSLFPT